MQLYFLIDQLAMLPQERAQKQTQVLNEILFIITAITVCFLHVGSQWQHLTQHTDTAVLTITHLIITLLICVFGTSMLKTSSAH